MDYFNTVIKLGQKGIVFDNNAFLCHLDYFRDILGGVPNYNKFLQGYDRSRYSPIKFHVAFIEFLRNEGDSVSLQLLFSAKDKILTGYCRDKNDNILKYSLTLNLHCYGYYLDKSFAFVSKQNTDFNGVSTIRRDTLKLVIGGTESDKRKVRGLFTAALDGECC